MQTRKGRKHQTTIPLLWSSTIIHLKLPFNSVILADDNSCLVIGNSKRWKKSCFCECLLEKRPSHLSHKGNSLQLFLACVWQLTISRYSEATFCLGAKDMHSFLISVVPWRCPLGDFDWRVSLLIQWQWPVQRTGLTKNAGHPCSRFLSCLSPRLLAALEFVIATFLLSQRAQLA